MVCGEVKEDSVPGSGKFYSPFSGTSGGKGSQRRWCQGAKTCMSQTRVMVGTAIVLKDSNRINPS